ncbi:MAG: hypothetical protein ACI85U_003662, partial [Candidatus Promineifilaceae bacterium]
RGVLLMKVKAPHENICNTNLSVSCPLSLS